MSIKHIFFYFLLVFASLKLFSEYEENKIHWRDLPQTSSLDYMNLSIKNLQLLKKPFEEYHKLQKDCLDTLPKRIAQIEYINSIIELCKSQKLQDLPQIHLLQNISSSKYFYLKKLQNIYQEKSYEKLDAYHNDLSSLKDRDMQVLFLRNDRLFSLKRKEYWGNFWWESLDPCHRQLSPYLQKWEEEKTNKPSTPHFFLWLENQYIPNNIPRNSYLNKIEAQKHQYLIINGLMCNTQTLIPLQSESNTRYILSISLNKQIYIAKSTSNIWHSSFTQGKALLSAAVISVSNGKLELFSVESGHYFPTLQNAYQTLSFFKNSMLQFENPLSVTYYHKGKQFLAHVFENDFTSYESFYLALLKDQKLKEVSNCEF